MKVSHIKEKFNNIIFEELEKSLSIYDSVHHKFPRLTNYAMQAIGTIGGDFIAKTSNGQKYTLRDIAFTAFASLPQSIYYPKIIDLANKINQNAKVHSLYNKLHISKDWARGITITALFFPINMLYWNYLSIKNRASLNLSTNLEGAKSIAEVSIPYLYVDYKVGQMPRRYALPVWSAAELGWNTFIALRNYLTK